MSPSEHSSRYFQATIDLAGAVDCAQVDAMARGLAALRERGGRLFILGVGGGAGHASHAVNDFRKLCGIESYAPTDNVSELTARTNDDGWDTSFTEWLAVSKLSESDGLLVFSVGGGSREHNVSVNLVNAIERGEGSRGVHLRRRRIARRHAGASSPMSRSCSTAPGDLKTPLVESFQAVVWHALVSHPRAGGHSRGTGNRWRPARVEARGVRRSGRDDRRAGPGPGQRSSRKGRLHAHDVALIPGAAAALRDLSEAGWLLIGVSNQPAAAKAKASLEELRRGSGAGARAAGC